MFVFYDPTTLAIHHVVDFHPPNYGDYLATLPNPGTYIESAEPISFPELYLSKDTAGVVTANKRTPAPNITAPTALQVNVEATFSGVPAGTKILINDVDSGTMDASGVLQFTPTTAGTYRFRFEQATAMPKEFSLEAVS